MIEKKQYIVPIAEMFESEPEIILKGSDIGPHIHAKGMFTGFMDDNSSQSSQQIYSDPGSASSETTVFDN